MKNEIIGALMAAVLLAAMPYTVLGEEMNTGDHSQKTESGPAVEAGLWEQARKALENPAAIQGAKTMYAIQETPVYEQPDENRGTYDTSEINTSFEVIGEDGGWSLVTTHAGVAFVKTECLADEPIDQWRLNYTDEDLYVLAHALAGESQNCPDEEQRYVGSVILNRVSSSRFPGTIRDVVFQRGQYSCTRDGNYYREPTERNWANAQWLLENGSVLPASVVWQSGGRQGKGVYIKTKYHYYCY